MPQTLHAVAVMPRPSRLLTTVVFGRGEMETLGSWGEAGVRDVVCRMSWRNSRDRACARCCVEPSSHSLLQSLDKCGPGKERKCVAILLVVLYTLKKLFG